MRDRTRGRGRSPASIEDADAWSSSSPSRARPARPRTLGIDPFDAQIRQVSFFDTPDLSSRTTGVVVRARRVQGAASDSVGQAACPSFRRIVSR